jgi:hypothetical protein
MPQKGVALRCPARRQIEEPAIRRLDDAVNGEPIKRDLWEELMDHSSVKYEPAAHRFVVWLFQNPPVNIVVAFMLGRRAARHGSRLVRHDQSLFAASVE